MIMDIYSHLADGVSIAAFTAAAGVEQIGNTYSSGTDDEGLRDGNVLGGGHKRLSLRIETAVAGTSSTVEFLIQTMTVGGSWVTVARSGAIAEATLIAGYWVFRDFSITLDATSDKVRVAADVGTADLSAGVVNAWISLD